MEGGSSMDMNMLQTFRAVAHHRSFTRAAAELGYAQSSVTMQMQKLEQYYDVKLFERSGRGLRLTSAGDELLRIAAQMLELHQLSRETLTRQSGGTLTIGTIDSIASYALPPIVQALRGRFPELTIRLVTGREPAVIEMVKDGEADVCLLLENRPPETELRWKAVREEPLVFAVGSAQPMPDIPHGIKLESLRDLDWIMAEESCNYRMMLERVLRDERIPYRIALELGNPEAIKRCLMTGPGISLLPRMAAEDELRRGELVELPVRHPGIRLHLYMGLRPKKWIAQPLAAFMEGLASV